MKQLLAIFLLSFLVSSCGPGKGYPAEVKDNFVKGCAAKANGNTALCDCVFEKIRERYSYKEFVDMENNMKKGIRSQPFMNFVDSSTRRCVAENGEKP
jgi:hypothetical protein